MTQRGGMMRGKFARGVATAALAVALANPVGAATVTWDGGTGSWDSAALWSGNLVPLAADDVFIDGGNALTSVVTVTGGARTIRSLSISTGDTLAIQGAIDFRVSTGALANNGTVRLGGSAGTSDWINPVAASFTGAGRFVLDDTAGAARIYSNALNNGAAHTIEGSGQLGVNQLALTNAGTIAGNVAGRTLSIDVAGGSGSVGFGTNTGTIRASGGGTVAFESGQYVNTGGLIEALAGSTVALNSDARIVGGTLTSVGTGRIAKAAGARAYIDDVTLSSGTVVEVRQGDFLYARGAIANNGTFEVRGAAGVNAGFYNDNAVTLSGTGTIVLDDLSGGAQYYGNSVALGDNQTVRGSGQFGLNQTGIDNEGLIVADVNGRTLAIDVAGGSGSVGFFDNDDGIVRATGGGTLRFESGRYVNTGGTIEALANSTVALNSDARIIGGTLTSVGTGRIAKVAGARAYMDGVSITTGTVVEVGAGDFLYITGAIAQNGTFNVRGNGAAAGLYNDAPVTLSGTGTIVLDDLAGGAQYYGNTVALGDNQTIRGSGQLGLNQTGIDNEGLIVADVGGRTLSIDVSGGNGSLGFFDNDDGVVRATGGGTIAFESGRYVNTGGLIEALAGSSVVFRSDARIIGGTLTSVGTGRFSKAADARAYLDGITLSAGSQLDVRGGDFLYLRDTITNQGVINIQSLDPTRTAALYADNVVTLAGSGTVVLDNSVGNALLYGNTIINSAGHTIRGAGQFGINLTAMDNRGLVVANVAGQTLAIDTAGGSGSVGNGLNTGTIRATGGGIVRFEGGQYDNTGGDIEALAGSTVVLANDARVIGGTLTSVGTGRLEKAANARAYVRDIEIAAGSVFVTRGGEFLYVENTITNNGRIEVKGDASGQSAVFANSATVTFAGAGELVMSNATANAVLYGNTIINTAGHSIRGSGQIGINQTVLDNRGLIAADEAARNLAFDIAGGSGSVGLFANTGVVRASGGGTATFESGRYDNTGGTFEVLDGSTFTSNSDANLPNLAGTTLTGGTYRAVASGSGATMRLRGGAGTLATVGSGAVVELSGSGSVIEFATISGGTFTPIDQTLTTVSGGGTLKVLNGRNLTIVAGGGGFTNGGITQLGGGTLTATSYANGGESFGFGTIAAASIANGGTVRANGGTLATRQITGAGAIVVDTGAALDLAAATGNSTANTLALSGALNLGTRNVTITSDYTNASFGAGDAFNGRANVTGTGLILAAGATQVLSGAGVSGGGSATPTIDLGVIRVGGSSSVTVTVTNTGALTTLRGAAQGNAAPGVTIGDADFVIGPNGGAHNFTIGFNGVNAGSLAGQSIAVVNNFDNVADQVAGITGAAFNAAVGAVTPATVALGNVRVGGVATGAISIANTAPAGAFSEGLRVTGTSASGDASVSGVTNGLIVAGAADAATVSINIATAGAKSGSVDFSFATDGTGTSGLAAQAIAGDSVGVTANVFALANPILSGSLNFGNVTQNSVATRTITVENRLLAGLLAGFQEGLNASFGAVAGDIASATGAITNLGAGLTDTTTLVVQLDTSAAGAKSGSAQILLVSNGAGTSGLGLFDLPSQTVTVLGQVDTGGSVFRLAAAGLAPTTIDLGNRRVGDAAPIQQLTITNTAIDDGFSERLDASVSGTTGRATTNGASVSLLGAQANSTAIQVGVDTSAAGANGSVTIAFASNGAGTSGNGVTPLAAQTVTLGGAVYRTALAGVTTPARITARVGDVATGTVTIANTAAADGFSEGLGVSATSSGAGVSFGSAAGLVAAGGSRGVAATVDTATAGVKSGDLNLSFTSDGTGTSGLAPLAIGGATATVEADVYAAAVANVSPTTIDFGVVRRGDTVATRNLAIGNAAIGALTDALVTSTGAAPSGFTLGATPGAIAAGASVDLAVGISTTTAGALSGTLDLGFVSRNPVLADLALPGQSILLTGTVNERASAVFRAGGAVLAFDAGLDGYVLDFGRVSVGADVGRLDFDLANLIGGPADDLSGTIFDASDDIFALLFGGPLGPLGAGEDSDDFGIDIDTSIAGNYTGRIAFNGVGTNASDLIGETIRANLFLRVRVADVAPVPAPAAVALFGLGVFALVAGRRRRRG